MLHTVICSSVRGGWRREGCLLCRGFKGSGGCWEDVYSLSEGRSVFVREEVQRGQSIGERERKRHNGVSVREQIQSVSQSQQIKEVRSGYGSISLLLLKSSRFCENSRQSVLAF